MRKRLFSMLEKNKKYTQNIERVIMGINCLLLLSLIVSSYSSYLSPTRFPYLGNMGLAFPLFLTITFLFSILWLILRKYKYHLTFWVTLLIISPQLLTYIPLNIYPEEPPKAAFKLLSYNVMTLNNLQKEIKGDRSILAYINAQDADIICLQEFTEGTNNKKYLSKKDIETAFKNYPYKSITKIGHKNARNKVACFSRFPIHKTEKIPYKSKHNGSVAYHMEIEGKTVIVINNHLESNKITLKDRAIYNKILKLENSDNLIEETGGLLNKIIEASVIREKQAKKLEGYIEKHKNRYIIACGDFNDSPLSRTNRLLSKHLSNAFCQTGLGLGISYNRNLFYFRIDNILISNNLKAYNCIVDNSVKLSDHYPIMCYIAFK